MKIEFSPALGIARATMLAVAGLALAAGAATAQDGGDATKGKVVFAKCGVCHAIEAGKTKIGPSLAGVVGRKSGTLPGFNYSAAMKASALVWTSVSLDRYLTKPSAMVPGNVMYFPGLPNAPDRADVIAYLKSPDKVK